MALATSNFSNQKVLMFTTNARHCHFATAHLNCPIGTISYLVLIDYTLFEAYQEANLKKEYQ